MSLHSAACSYPPSSVNWLADDPAGCSVPPVVAKDYQIKGEYIHAAGMKTCISFLAGSNVSMD